MAQKRLKQSPVTYGVIAQLERAFSAAYWAWSAGDAAYNAAWDAAQAAGVPDAEQSAIAAARSASYSAEVSPEVTAAIDAYVVARGCVVAGASPRDLLVAVVQDIADAVAAERSRCRLAVARAPFEGAWTRTHDALSAIDAEVA